LALSVPLSRFTSQVGGGSAFFVRQQASRRFCSGIFRGGDFGGSFRCHLDEFKGCGASLRFRVLRLSRLTPFDWFRRGEEKSRLICRVDFSYDENAA
jgi:hypothetical protein